jgi:threonyl-tRNA synthetase
MAHVFYRENGEPFTLSPIEVVAEPIAEDFYELLEDFGAKCDEILEEGDE